MSLIPNFNLICRTCLAESKDLKSIFLLDSIFEERFSCLKDLLMSFASIQIVEGDGLPENICLNCVQELNKVVSFRKLCERSDATVRLWLATLLQKQNKEELYEGFREKKEELEENFNKQNSNECFDSAVTEFIDVFNAGDTKKYGSDSENDATFNSFCNSEIGDETYVCSECNTNFANSIAYERHMIDEHTKPYKCEICGKTFKIETFLKKHLAAHEITEKRTKQKLPRTCTICNKTFRFHSNLERHKLIHTGEKPYLCNVCGKSFTQLSYLKIHSFIHTGEKPYKCQLCERSFGAPGTLMTHIRTHTGERPHICKICGKDFPQSGYLSAHVRIHTGEKPAECKVCHRRFNQSGRLTVHMRMHSGEKPFTCRDCGRSFAVKGTLKKHMRTHTGERPYICSVCGQAFAQSGTLSTHMKVHKPKLVV